MDCVGRSGGLILFWKDNIDLSIQSYFVGHFDCIVNQGSKEWIFTEFYGHPVVANRVVSWKVLRRLANIHELNQLLWLVGGDFNEILFESE